MWWKFVCRWFRSDIVEVLYIFIDGFDGLGLKRSFVGIVRGISNFFGGGIFGFYFFVNLVVVVESVFILNWRGFWVVILRSLENFVRFIFL